MGTTPNYGLPYPEGGDIPAGATQIKNLADAVDATLPLQMPRDTGWRNISSLLINSFTGTVHLRRVGRTVHLQIYGVTRAASVPAGGAVLLANAPAGFTPSGYALESRPHLYNVATSTIVANSLMRMSGDLNVWVWAANLLANQSVYEPFTYATSDAWPTTLPGTPYP